MSLSLNKCTESNWDSTGIFKVKAQRPSNPALLALNQMLVLHKTTKQMERVAYARSNNLVMVPLDSQEPRRPEQAYAAINLCINCTYKAQQQQTKNKLV
jgi:hypothetical protein